MSSPSVPQFLTCVECRKAMSERILTPLQIQKNHAKTHENPQYRYICHGTCGKLFLSSAVRSNHQAQCMKLPPSPSKRKRAFLADFRRSCKKQKKMDAFPTRFGTATSGREYDRNNLRENYVSSALRDQHRVPKDVKKQWGFQADDIIKAAEKANVAQLSKYDGTKWWKIYQCLENLPTHQFQALIAPPNEGQLGIVLQKVLRKEDPSHPLLSSRFRELPPLGWQHRWGFTLAQAKAMIEKLDSENGGIPVSYRAAAMQLGNDDFRTRRNNGQCLKKGLYSADREWVKRRQAKIPKNRGGNPGYRRQLRVTEDGVALVPRPPSRAIAIALKEAMEENPELKESIVGRRVSVIGVRTRVLKKIKGKYVPVIKIRDMQGQIFNARIIFQHLFEKLYKGGMLADGVTTYFLKVWADGASLGCIPGLKGMLSLMNQPDSFINLTVDLARELSRRRTWFLLPLSEGKHGLNIIRKLIAPELLSLAEPFQFGSKELSIRLCLVCMDTKASRLFSGVNTSGYFACASCYIHRFHFNSYAISTRQRPRTWQTTTKNVLCPDSLCYEAGDICVPVWANGGLSDLDREDLKYIQCGSEMMHIVEGISPLLFERIVATVSVQQKPIFEAAVKTMMHRDNADLSTKMCARDWREFWCLHEFILPISLWRSNRSLGTRITLLVQLFSCLIHENYSKAARTRKRILGIYVRTFLFSQLCRDLFKSEITQLVKTHFHQLEIHVPFLWRCVHPSDNLAEDEERSWKDDRLVVKSLSNHKEDNLDYVAIHHYFAEQKRQHLKATTELLESVAASLPEENLVVPARYVYNSDFPYFLFSIRDFEEGMWYRFQEDGSCVFFTGSLRVEDDRVLPTEPRDFASVVAEMDSCWESIQSSRSNSRSVLLIKSVDTSTLDPLVGVPYEEWRLKDLKVLLNQRLQATSRGSARYYRLTEALKARDKKKKGDFIQMIRADEIKCRIEAERAKRPAAVESNSPVCSVSSWLSRNNLLIQK